MPTFRTKPAEIAVDRATGALTLGTPWGIVAIREGDMIVPDGDRAVPIPERLWRQWFDDASAPIPAPPAFVAPALPLAEWLRADLERYAVEVLGEEPPRFPRKALLVQWVSERARGPGELGPLDVGGPPLRREGIKGNDLITVDVRRGVVVLPR